MKWVEFILQLGAVSTALTAVGRILIYLYQKYVTEPQNQRVEEMYLKSSSELKETITPLTISIERLNYLLEEGKADREKLHEKSEALDGKVGDHEVRINRLEDWREYHEKH